MGRRSDSFYKIGFICFFGLSFSSDKVDFEAKFTGTASDGLSYSVSSVMFSESASKS